MRRDLLFLWIFAISFQVYVNAQIGVSSINGCQERFKVWPLKLSHVRLLGGLLKQIQYRDAEDLLKLEPKAEPYGGWDSTGKNLTDHIADHCLSALSFIWATTGDERSKNGPTTSSGNLQGHRTSSEMVKS